MNGIYLDNSATTKPYPEVTAAVAETMERVWGNPSSLHHLGVEAELLVKEARRQVADALCSVSGAAVSPAEIFFTSGGTESDNTAILRGAAARARAGKHLVTTRLEHPAVLEAFRGLEEQGFSVTRLAPPKGGARIDPADLDAAVGPETTLVSIMQVNNETGACQPVREASEILRRASESRPAANRILLHCDGVQAFGKEWLGDTLPYVDLYSISGHKFHGPKGIGVLYVRGGVSGHTAEAVKHGSEGHGINIKPFLVGGGEESGMRSGTENVPAIVGLGIAAKLAAERLEENRASMSALRERLWRGLVGRLDDVCRNTPMPAEGGAGRNGEGISPAVLNVSFPGTKGEVILHSLEKEGIYVSTGAACSSHKKGGSHVLTAMCLSPERVESAIRFSLSEFTTEAEIDETIEKTVQAVDRFRLLGRFR